MGDFGHDARGDEVFFCGDGGVEAEFAGDEDMRSAGGDELFSTFGRRRVGGKVVGCDYCLGWIFRDNNLRLIC